MSSSSSGTYTALEPALTPPPKLHTLKRRRQLDRRSSSDTVAHDVSARELAPRTLIPDQAQIANAEQQCQDFSGNNVISCWPLSNTSVPQHQWATFVWNSRRPQLLQNNLVNIYLFRANGQQLAKSFLNQTNDPNQAGSINDQIDDSWFGPEGGQWDGTDIPFPFYWVITDATEGLDGSQIPQATFTAVQTTFADSVIASMSASSASAASSRSAASASAAALRSSITDTVTVTGGISQQSFTTGPNGSRTPVTASTPSATGSVPTSSNGTGAVQSSGGSSNFPHWAIAVIVVLGFLALVASGILAFFIVRRVRAQRTGVLSNRGSMGSSTPMMANVQQPNSPLLGPGTAAGFGGAAEAGLGGAAIASHRPQTPIDTYDGASTMSRVSDAALFSGADAAIMADAFRKALRKPDFADRPVEEGESPDNGNGPDARDLLTQQLAEEGRDIRSGSVSSSRGVRVETLSDEDATVQPH